MPAGQPGLFWFSVLGTFGSCGRKGCCSTPRHHFRKLCLRIFHHFLASCRHLPTRLRGFRPGCQWKGPLTRPEYPLAGHGLYREDFGIALRCYDLTCVWQTWQRLTLPRLETKYHQRWSVSRPSSEWDRVQPLRHNHQVGKTHVVREAV